jgi:hypothetical protein
MAVTLEEAIDLWIQLWPKGRLYDWYNTSADIYKLFASFAETFKLYGYDVIDTLRAELEPRTAVEKVIDFEEALGIAGSRTAKSGTLTQRRAAVIAKFREWGAGFRVHTIKAVLGTLLGYANPPDIEVLEVDRAGLKLQNSYGMACDFTIPNAATTTIPIYVRDGGIVSPAGAQLNLLFDAAPLTGFTIRLTAPNKAYKEWVQGATNLWQSVPVVLYAAELAGAACNGVWQLAITNASGSDRTLYSDAWLFVEGLARGQRTGGAIFTWGVAPDPNQVTNADYASAELSVQRLGHAHTEGALVLSKEPWPTVFSGPNAAIPGRCIPHTTV